MMDFTPEKLEQRLQLFRICTSREELHAWVYYFLDLDLPGVVVDPESNTTPLDMVWQTYAHFTGVAVLEDTSRVLYYACRDGGKTLAQSVIEVLALLHLDISVVHLAAIEQQSVTAQRYLKKFLNLPASRDFLFGDNVRETAVSLWRPETPDLPVLTEKEYRQLPEPEKGLYRNVVSRAEIVVATMQSTNGKHAALLCLDELDVIANPTAYAESVNIPTAIRRPDGTLQMPLTILTSTRKSAFGLVQDEINRASKTKLKIFHWNLIDVTESCPPARHRPDLPKLKLYASQEGLRHVDEAGYAELAPKDKEHYAAREGFAGCKACPLFAVCGTRLATVQTGDSRFLKPIPHTINQFQNNSLEMAKAQLLCLKPASTGLIYSRFDRTRHVITPAQAYARIFGEPPLDPKAFTKSDLVAALREREVQWYSGVDWGSTHHFSYVNGFKDGARFFVTHCVSLPGLDPDQMLEVSAPFLEYAPAVYPDTADPKMIALFKKHGHRMIKWKKTPGSVVGGINIVRLKLNPPMGQPELFFVVEPGGLDHGMEFLVTSVAEYHWKNDAAGNPTDIPSEDKDDCPDALRYLMMNVFSMRGGVSVSTAQDEAPSHGSVARPDGQYQGTNWLAQRIAELTGAPAPEPTVPAAPRRMIIEVPTPSGYRSYYADDPAPKRPQPEEQEAATPVKGRRGRLSWDLG